MWNGTDVGPAVVDTDNNRANMLRVLIIGCGNIAGGFDEGRTSGYFPYTHAGAYVRDGRFNIAACVEPDNDRRTTFMKVWGIPIGFCSIDELLDSGEQFDVVSICSPTTHHTHDLEAALHLQAKIIFCEKPMTRAFSETERLLDKYNKANIPLAVNYTRRWDPDILKLQVDMSAGRWGKLRSIVGLYNKGILNNGSHMLDLLYFLVGPISVINVGKPVNDFFADDPTVPVWLEGEQGVPIHLTCAHAEDYAVFEMQFVFSLGILSMEEGGMFWNERRVVDSDIFNGYQKPGESVRRPGKYPQAMRQAVDNIYRAITQDAPLASTGETALITQRVCEDIKRQACTR